MKRFLTLIIIVALFAVPSVFATITFDPATGFGFVGKGDVQIACAWNNAQCQANGKGVAFSYNSSDTYAAVCTWYTAAGGPNNPFTIEHDVTIPKHTSVNDTISYDARTHKQIDGYNLTGFGSVVIDGTVPVVGGSCPGPNGEQGTWSSVTQTSSSGGNFQINCPTP